MRFLSRPLSPQATYLESGLLNGLFVLGRSIGFIGHFLDQTRLKQPLYRHPWSDITRVHPVDVKVTPLADRKKKL